MMLCFPNHHPPSFTKSCCCRCLPYNMWDFRSGTPKSPTYQVVELDGSSVRSQRPPHWRQVSQKCLRPARCRRYSASWGHWSTSRFQFCWALDRVNGIPMFCLTFCSNFGLRFWRTGPANPSRHSHQSGQTCTARATRVTRAWWSWWSLWARSRRGRTWWALSLSLLSLRLSTRSSKASFHSTMSCALSSAAILLRLRFRTVRSSSALVSLRSSSFTASSAWRSLTINCAATQFCRSRHVSPKS